jgi:hypothetical protein
MLPLILSLSKPRPELVEGAGKERSIVTRNNATV